MVASCQLSTAAGLYLLLACATLVNWVQASSLQLRLDVTEFFSKENSIQSNLFLQAFDALQNLPEDDYNSYFQISGIHGLPHVPYRGSVNSGVSSRRWSTGYCQHSSVLFPTWHRAYMNLMESAVRNQSIIIANKYEDAELKQKYIEAASTMRFPFLDWSSPSVATDGLPEIFVEQWIQVFVPPMNASKRIQNPLHGFTTPTDIGSRQYCRGCNPFDRPYRVFEIEGSFHPWLPKGYRTVRHPSTNNATMTQQLQKAAKAGSIVNWQTGIFRALRQSSWFKFSNRAGLNDGSMESSGSFFYGSLEQVHDSVHLALGGWAGQLAYRDTAAFDPLFWFIHSHVDFIFAVWQQLHPDLWIEEPAENQETFALPAMVVDSRTPLAPFRQGNGAEENPYLTSDDVRYHEDLGYSYKFVEEIRAMTDPSERYNAVMERFSPQDGSYEYRWYVELPKAQIINAPGPFSIRVFVGVPFEVDTAFPTESEYFAGSFDVWQRDPIHGPITDFVDITACMNSLGIATTPMIVLESRGDYDSPRNLLDDVIPSITEADLQFVIVGIDGSDYRKYVNLGDPVVYFEAL